MQTEWAEEALKHQPIEPTPRKDAVTLRIHQTLWISWQTLELPWSIWPTGGEKAANSFPSPHVLCSVSFCFSQKLWEIVVRGFPWWEAEG